MGVLTNVYSVPAKVMKKIDEDNERLGFLFGDEESADAKMWQVDKYDFDKRFDDVIRIMRAAGLNATYKALDVENPGENEPEYDPYDIKRVSPAKVKKIAAELAPITFMDLKKKGLEQEVSDWHSNRTIGEAEYSSYVGDIEKIKAFFQKAADAGNFIIIAVA
jgi:hypothetical protein